MTSSDDTSSAMASDHSATSAAADSSSSSNHNRKVRFDERCRVRPIKKLCYVEQEVRDKLWYNRDELKNMRKECRDLMKEALHELQKAHAKQKKKLAQERLQEMGQESHPCSPRKQQENAKRKNKAKHLFPPSAFRGLEMFHPKMSFKREGRRQEQWEAILTEQALQDVTRKDEESSDDETETSNKRLPKEEDLLHLAKLSLSMSQVASKEAHKRALRDQQDLLHPPKYWMLPWLHEDGTTKKTRGAPRKILKKDTPLNPPAMPAALQSDQQESPKPPRSSIKKKTDLAAALAMLQLDDDASSQKATAAMVESPRRAKLREFLQLKGDQPRPSLTPSLSAKELQKHLRT